MDVQKSRNVTQVKETYVSQIDRLLVKHGRGNHAPCDEVPNAPDISPVRPTWNTERAYAIILLRLLHSVVRGGC